MQHSHEALDREGGFSRANLLTPLRHRDFRVLWTGMTVSLIGDGVFLVAMTWQVYALSNAPTALAMVGIAMTVPTILLLLFGGVVTDRFDRRRVLIVADVVRGVAVAVMAVLSLTGTLELWHMMRAGGRLRRRHRRSSGRRSTRSCPTCCPRASSPRPTRSTSSCARSRSGWSARRWAAG